MSKPLKIALVNVEDGIMSVGFRKITAFIKLLNPDTSTYYVCHGKFRSLGAALRGRIGECQDITSEDIRKMAETFAQSDLVGFSSMTGYAKLTADLISQVRLLNPKCYIVWGGIHPIIVSDDAIQHADAICTGEGEQAFKEFLELFKSGQDYTKTRGFWFRKNGQVIKNGFLPLMTNEEMSALPLPNYGKDELIYSSTRGAFIPLTPARYLRENGLSYNTVWSIGCPFKCTYCGNTKFIENDKSYRKLRHPDVKYIVNEIRQAVQRHPHISTVVFHDDSFMALPTVTLAEFAKEYKKQVNIPFCVQGVIPNYVRPEKLEILLSAGLNRVRMGIQNGSERILQFYDRATPIPRILEAATVFRNHRRYMIPPAYDIILDNPVETRQDVVDNLELLYRLPRPYTLNIFSLRSIPNTVLEKQMKERNISLDKISASYFHNAPTAANCLVYVMATCKIPRWVFEVFLKRARPLLDEQPLYPRLCAAARAAYLVRRGLYHLRFMDFSVVSGRLGYFCWWSGLIGFWYRHVIPKFAAESESNVE